MLDIGWQELMVIGALALIVVGPKDLPGLLRSVGQWVGRIRGMARDFQRTMNEAARETEMTAFKDLKDIQKMNPLDDFKKQAENAQSYLSGTGDEPPQTDTAKTEPEKTTAPEAEPDPGMVDTSATEPVVANAPAAEAPETVSKAASS